MRRTVALFVGVLMSFALAMPASAHLAGPCNGDEPFTGANYAKHHISAFAKAGLLGNDGHKPGTHRGVSVCVDVAHP